MAVVTRYVNTASAGGDGTTNGESGANAAYASLNAWEAAEQTDLVAAGDSHVVECSTGSGTAADSTGVSILGWTTSATYDMTIKQATSDRHSGIFDTSKARLSVTNTSGINNVNATALYLNLDGLQLEMVSTSGSNQVLLRDRGGGTTSTVLVENCIFKGYASNASSYCDGIQVYQAGTSSYTVRNCIFYDFLGTNSGGVMCWDVSGTFTVQNCTFYNCNFGLYEQSGTITPTNCATIGCTDGFASLAGGDYNCSDISGDAPGANSVYTTQADSALFTDATTDDFNVADSSSDLYNNGTDLSGSFTDDITGYTRSTWDIGAFELQAGTTYNESLALSLSAALSMSNTLTLDEALSLSSGAALAPGSAADLVASLSMGASASVVLAAIQTLEAALSLAGSAGFTGEGTISGSTYNESLTLSAGASVTQAVTAVLEAAQTLSASAAITQSDTLTLDESITLSGNASQTASADLIMEVTSSLAAIAQLVLFGQIGDALLAAKELVLNMAKQEYDLELALDEYLASLANDDYDLEM